MWNETNIIIRIRRLAILILIILIVAATFSIIAASNTINPTSLDNITIGVIADDFKPPECAGILIAGFNKNSGNALILGTSGNDNLNGGNFNDCIVGGAGNDRLSGKAGDDVLVGGDGDDILDGDAHVAGDTCYGGAGTDTNRQGQCEVVFGIP